MAKISRPFDWTDSFQRLEQIAGQASPLNRMEQLYRRNESKHARGEKVTGCMTVVAVPDWPMKEGRTCRGPWEAGLERPIRRMGHGGRANGWQAC